MEDRFLFHRSFWEAVENAPRKYQLELYDAICIYTLYGEEPELSPGAEKIFTQMRTNIDTVQKRYRAAIKNGKSPF